MKEQLKNLDKLNGNVDTLSNRISNVRTWAYVSNKKNWTQNQDYWIARTKAIEDKLSDRLHEELTKSFIDKRASVLARGLKQNIVLETKIMNEKDVVIDGHYIGELRGLKLYLDFKTGASDADIKSLKKAARNGIGPELIKRVDSIIDNGILKLDEDFKIYWLKHPIAQIIPGKNYLEPDITLITDDILDPASQNKLIKFLNDWIKKIINSELRDLVNLNKFEKKNSSVRALCYQLFENNGVLKREEVNEFIKKLDQNDRKTLRQRGVKIGRYHIFLHRIFKPSAVSMRILLWKNFFRNNLKLTPPKFGLNFLELEKNIDIKFMLICGFEKINNFFVRIDILERLFVIIIENVKDNKIKLNPTMMNLLGCTKENFLKLIESMNYKMERSDKDGEIFFKYMPKKVKNKKFSVKEKIKDDSPFNILTNITFNYTK